MKFDFLGLRKSVDSLVTNLREVSGNIESLRRQREELAVAPLTRDDAIAILHKRIDNGAKNYLRNFTASTLDPVIRKGYKGTAETYNNPILAAPAIGHEATPRTLEAGIFFALNQPVKDAIAKAVREMDWPAGAVSLVDRAAQLQKLDDEIAKLEEEELRLSRYAADAGIIVSSEREGG